ncbi:MAG: nitrophenyl compound nitroreductase subunit ArsF family protein [Shewanella sp.]
MKKVISYLLLGVVCLGFALVGYQQWSVPAGQTTAATDNPVAAASVLKNGLNVYYFHGNQRCTTCVKMEAFTQKALMENFSKEVRDSEMQLDVVNLDLNENQHYIEDYQLAFRTVVISTSKDGVETEWRRLDRIWELAKNELAFKQYVTEEIAAMLAHSHG